jgi:hypothetical protein
MYLEAISAYLIILLLTVGFEWGIRGSVETKRRLAPILSQSRRIYVKTWVNSFAALDIERIDRVVNAVI